MARIAHIMIRCDDGDAIVRAAGFYESVFGLRRRPDNNDAAVRLTDGNFDISLVVGAGAQRILRIGVEVDDPMLAQEKLIAHGGAVTAKRRDGVIEFHSPDGMAVEIVGAGCYGGCASVAKSRIVHVAVKVVDLDQETAFYENGFNFHTLTSGHARGHISRHMAAGDTDLALMLYDNEDVPEAQLAGPGACIHHFGLEVDDRVATACAIATHGGDVLSQPEKGAWKFRAPDGALAEIVERKGFEVFRRRA